MRDLRSPFAADFAGVDADRLARTLKALADRSRIRLLNAMLQRPDGLRVVDMNGLGVTQPTVSHHLRILESAGLVERVELPRTVRYRADRDALSALAELLRPGGVR